MIENLAEKLKMRADMYRSIRRSQTNMLNDDELMADAAERITDLETLERAHRWRIHLLEEELRKYRRPEE